MAAAPHAGVGKVPFGALSSILVVVAAGCSAGSAHPAGPATDPDGDGRLSVHRGRFEERFVLTGQLAAVHAENLVVPAIPSWQTTIRWLEEEGAVVKAGHRVVEFDTASFAQERGEKRLALDQARGELDQTRADQAGRKAEKDWAVAQKTIAVDKAKIAAEIPAEFLKGRDYQSNQLALARVTVELEKAREDRTAFEASSAEMLRQKQIALDKARRDYEAAGQAIDGMVLKAPRDGILVVADHPWQGRKLQVGDSVWVGLPVVSLPDLDVMQVEAKLSDVDDGRIVAGLLARCVLDAYPDRSYAGRVAEITPVAQEAAGRSLRRAYAVRIELDASDAQRMRPGMSVKVDVSRPARDNVLLAPRAGLDFNEARPRARLSSGRLVDVTLGPCGPDACVLESGLAEGASLRAEE